MIGLTKSNESMRVIIYGAGAVGGVVGGHLAHVGNDVIFIGRSDHVNTIREHGLRVVTPTSTYILRVPAVTTPDQIDFGPDDVVLLCVKSQNTDEALRDLRAVVEDVPIFCFQNGVRNEENATRYFPRVYGVRVYMASVFLTNGEAIASWNPPGWLIMGCYPTGTDDLVEAMAANLSTAGFFVLVTPEVMPYKWGKLMGNLANAVAAITNNREDNNDRVVQAAMQEAREILAQAGIRWVSTEELALEWAESTIQPRIRPDIKAYGSTWQSLARRQGTVETDFLNGEIVWLAKRLGSQAPVNEALLRISQQMAAAHELPGKYTSTELCRLIGLD